MNKVILSGRLTKDPELKQYDNSCKAVFTIAVNRNKEEADFIGCEVWNKQAESLTKYQKKGNQIIVEGELRIDKYEKDGKDVYSTKVLARSIEFLGSKKDNEDKDAEQYKDMKTKTAVDPYQEFGDTIEVDDDDLPF